MADSHRLTPPCWVIPLLDRIIESVRVNADDFASLPSTIVMDDSMGHEQKGYMTPKDAERDAWFARLHRLLLPAESYSGHERNCCLRPYREYKRSRHQHWCHIGGRLDVTLVLRMEAF